MSAGRLRHHLVLENRIQAPNDQGGITETYAEAGQAWAEILAVGAVLYAAGQQVQEKVTHKITIRFRPMTGFGFLSDGARRFRLREMRDPDGRRMWLELLCEELRPGSDM